MTHVAWFHGGERVCFLAMSPLADATRTAATSATWENNAVVAAWPVRVIKTTCLRLFSLSTRPPPPSTLTSTTPPNGQSQTHGPRVRRHVESVATPSKDDLFTFRRSIAHLGCRPRILKA